MDEVPRELLSEAEAKLIIKIRESENPQAEAKSAISSLDRLRRMRGTQPLLPPAVQRGVS